jgi:hypothetical protein
LTSYLFHNDVRSLLGNLNTSRSKATGEQEPDLKVHSMLRRLILIFALIVVVVFVIALPVLTGGPK